MRVGLLTQWYDPEPGPAALPGVLARGLLSRGHDVQVLTGFPNYPTGAVADGYRVRRSLDEVRDGVHIRRVALWPSHDASAARRFGTYASFGASAALFGLNSLTRLDALWVNYSPITIAWPMWAARLTLGVPSVVHVLDLWPDTILAGGYATDGLGYRAAKRILDLWCGGMYASASSVAYISPSVGQVLLARGVPARKLHYVPMWADEEVFRPGGDDLRAELGIGPDQVVLLYAGALGEAQGLTSLIDACAAVTDPRFVCLIAGSGISESSLRARAEEQGAGNVRFVGRVPQEQMTSLMATGDLNYLGLRSHPLSAMTMPSKAQAALASARALLVAADGDIARLVQEAEAGFVVHPDDVTGIAAAIAHACGLGREGLAELGARARACYERDFSAHRGITQIEALLDEAATTRRGSS